MPVAKAGTTPQAVDDTAQTTQDAGIVLDVLRNDRGGAARSLYAVDATSRYGAHIAIDGGVLRYDPHGSAALDALGAGEQAQDSFQYAVRMGNGTWSWAAVHVTVTGINDVPLMLPDASVARGLVTELPDRAPGENTATLATAGSLAFADPDAHDSFTVSARALGSGYVGALALGPVDAQHHTVSWSFTVQDAQLDALNAGETRVQTYEVQVVDSAGAVATQQVTVTLAGAADAASTYTPDAYVAAMPVGAGGDAVLRDVAGAAPGTAVDAFHAGVYGVAAAGDLDGDGRTDIARADYAEGGIVRLLLDRGPDANGATRFDSLALPVAAAPQQVGDIAIGDVDGDGRADLLVGTGAGAALYLGTGDDANGLPRFRAADLPATNSKSFGVAIGDLNHDGRADLVVGGYGEDGYVLTNLGDRGDGAPAFAAQALPAGLGAAGHLSLGDVNGDGAADILAPAFGGATEHSLYLNLGDADGDGRPEFQRVALPGQDAVDSALADLDGDGDLDVVVFETAATRIFLNQGAHGGTPVFATQQVDVAGSYGGSVGDIDGDGDLDFIRASMTGVQVATNAGTAPDGAIDWQLKVVGGSFAFDAVLVDF